VNGASSTWHSITRRTEAFPGTPAPTPTDKVTGTGPANQGYTGDRDGGVWTDKQNGVYTYTFARSLQNDAEIPYERLAAASRRSRDPADTGDPGQQRRLHVHAGDQPPGQRVKAARSSTTTPATRATTTCRSTAAHASTCSYCAMLPRVVFVRRAVRQLDRP